MLQAIKKFLAGGDSIGDVLTASNPRGAMESLAMSISPEEARRNLTVQAAVGAVARLVSPIPFESSGRAQRVIDEPNRHQTTQEFIAGVAYDTLLYGNAFNVNLRTRGETVGIAPLDPARIRVSTDAIGDPVYLDSRSAQRWTLDEVTHIRDVGTGGHGLVAPSRLDSGGTRLRALIAADNLISDTFTKGIHVQYTVTSDDPISNKRARAIMKVIGDMFGLGGSNRGGAAVLGNAKLEKVPGLTPADADLRGIRQHLMREIAAAFGVPEHMVSGSSDSRYANHVSAGVNLLRDTLSPLAYSIAARLARTLGAPVRPKLAMLIAGDFQTVAAVGNILTGGPVLTVNEARAEFHGLPPDSDPASNTIQARTGPVPLLPGARAGENDDPPED